MEKGKKQQYFHCHQKLKITKFLMFFLWRQNFSLKSIHFIFFYLSLINIHVHTQAIVGNRHAMNKLFQKMIKLRQDLLDEQPFSMELKSNKNSFQNLSHYKFYNLNHLMDSQKKNWNISPFIQKLEQMLHESENYEIIRYDQNTKKIEIRSKKEMENILPKYFRHGRFESFVRQLNWYGFHKVNNRAIHCYEHPDLEKGLNFSNIKSTRLPLKKSAPKEATGSPEQENIPEAPIRKTLGTQTLAIAPQPQTCTIGPIEGMSVLQRPYHHEPFYPMFQYFHPNQMMAPTYEQFPFMRNYF